jgi:hypothetical protein
MFSSPSIQQFERRRVGLGTETRRQTCSCQAHGRSSSPPCGLHLESWDLRAPSSISLPAPLSVPMRDFSLCVPTLTASFTYYTHSILRDKCVHNRGRASLHVVDHLQSVSTNTSLIGLDVTIQPEYLASWAPRDFACLNNRDYQLQQPGI